MKTQKRSFQANLDSLYEMLRFVEDYACQINTPKEIINKIILATEEIVVNIIAHGYSSCHINKLRPIEIICSQLSSGIQIVIKDEGIPFNPINPLPHQIEEIGGYGILICEGLMDSIDYCRENDSNVLTMIKKIS